jgi:ribonucleotide monophosphatase NagD (HAD superfamily)
MELSYAGICFDLFGTLVSEDGAAIVGARETLALLGAGRWAIVTRSLRARRQTAAHRSRANARR